jgi:glycine/D-amino acid oxidase-like deaminating enzyme
MRKREQERKREKVLTAEHRTFRCTPDGGPVHGLANSLLSGFLACVGYNSSDSLREAQDSLVCQPRND